MYRQQYGEKISGYKHYSTEVAGRDRFLFFKRPNEGDGINGGAATASQNNNNNNNEFLAQTYNDTHIRYAASCPPTPPESSARGRGNQLRSYAVTNSAATAAGGSRRPLDINNNNNRNAYKRGRGEDDPAAAATYGGRDVHSAGSAGGGPRARRYRLPPVNADSNSNNNNNNNVSVSAAVSAGRARDAVMQTDYRENETNTDPYSPDFTIREALDARGNLLPDPEILGLRGLTVRNGGLPAGKEEVELIQRLRRRREVEQRIAAGTADGTVSVEKKFALLHALEEEEWAEREAHAEQLQQRRLERLRDGLYEREAEREAANQRRLRAIAAGQMGALAEQLARAEAKNEGEGKRSNDVRGLLDFEKNANLVAAAAHMADHTNTTAAAAGQHYYNTNRALLRYKPKRDLIDSYNRYGIEAAPPVVESPAANSTTNNNNNNNSSKRVAALTGGAAAGTRPRGPVNYDIRPTLLNDSEGLDTLAARGGTKKGTAAKIASRAATFNSSGANTYNNNSSSSAHANANTASLKKSDGKFSASTLHQQREEQKVRSALDHVYEKIQLESTKGRGGIAGAQEGVGSGADNDQSPQFEGDVPNLHDVSNNNNNTINTTTNHNDKIDSAKMNRKLERQRILGLYRTTPKIERPATPVLELDGDDSETEEENIILLQRLLRGRAVQNDFFEGKERCRGLITELQAASNIEGTAARARELFDLNNSSPTRGDGDGDGEAEGRRGGKTAAAHDVAEEEEWDPERFVMLDADPTARCEYFTDNILSSAAGDIIADTLGYLHIELERQRSVQELQQLHDAAESVRRAREEEEAARRRQLVLLRARHQAQYTSLRNVTDRTIGALLPSLLREAVAQEALDTAVREEKERLAELPAPRLMNALPLYTSGAEAAGGVAALPVTQEEKDAVCDTLDQFVIPAVLDSETRREYREGITKPPAVAALSIVNETLTVPLQDGGYLEAFEKARAEAGAAGEDSEGEGGERKHEKHYGVGGEEDEKDEGDEAEEYQEDEEES